jgi:uncharacterized membrane protein YeaQ/YmgE (transglycosylase-associated protein family)
MADPITLAMVGAAAGAVTNKKDPLKGALMGATLGGVGGAVAPSLLGATATQAASGAAGAVGLQSGFGAQLAGHGLLSSAPMMSGGASPVAGALAAQGMTSAPAMMSTAGAAPSMMSKLANPQTLMAGAQLASSMGPQPAQTAFGRVTPGQQIPIAFQPPPIAMTPLTRFSNMMPIDEELGIGDVPSMIRTQMRPGQDDLMLEYFPSRRR